MRAIGCLLAITVLLVAPTSAIADDNTRKGTAEIHFFYKGAVTSVYELTVVAPGRTYGITASKRFACPGFLVGDTDIPATFNQTTITLTKGKSVCELDIESMN